MPGATPGMTKQIKSAGSSGLLPDPRGQACYSTGVTAVLAPAAALRSTHRTDHTEAS
jgi:hypothetical protein